MAYKKRAMKLSLRWLVMPCSDWLKFCLPTSSTLVLNKQLMSFCYAHDYCQMHKGDASEKVLVCVTRHFSAMYDQTVTIKRP